MSFTNGILSGVGELVDAWLELSFTASAPLYHHKTAALELGRRSQIPPADTFLRQAYNQIDTNWHASSYKEQRPPSRENWRVSAMTPLSSLCSAHNRWIFACWHRPAITTI